MRYLAVRSAVAAVLALALTAGLVLGADPGVRIETVDGRAVGSDGRLDGPVSGTVRVTGTAVPGGGSGSGAPARTPLVADAGDSSFVKVGQPAYLVGAGFGGLEPYTFQWSSDAGTLVAADAPEAILDTTGMSVGTHTVGLTVTDAAGGSASDTVKIAVYDPKPVTLLDETRADNAIGTFATGQKLEFPFTVPAGTIRFDVAATWGIPANDYDLEIYDPDGVSHPGSGNPPPEFETAGVGNPRPGVWKAVLVKYATVLDTVTVKVTAIDSTDPLPSVDTTGPYRFVIGEAQALSGGASGGTAPLKLTWDTDFDGRPDAEGTSVTTNLGSDRHFVTFKVTDAKGFERRETTSVFIGTAERVAEVTSAFSVIGVADSGINPYHLEFSARTYPDPEILALTDNFTRHPSEYIPGFPTTAQALPITLDRGYYPPEDQKIWDSVELGKLYWIPGTKIVGAIDANDASASNAAADGTPILDDDGHGTGSSSVSTGNRYGYCPSCLLFFVEGLDESVAANFSFVDITSHSFGYVYGVPGGLLNGPNESTRAAAERGQTVLFAAGNGVGNAFDVPQVTYGSDQAGASWNITVGAIRRDNNRAVVGDGIPVDISAWGDGNLPSACRTGTVGQCAFGGTSAATPYTAGIFGTVLTEVRRAIGDPKVGQRAGQVVAEGIAIPDSIFLDDGRLTRAELRDAVLKTAFPLNTENSPSPFPYPATAPYADNLNVLFEGYGAATPESAKRAIDVILGRVMMPDRSFEDQFFALDRAVKDTIYGGYDRDGDGSDDFEGLAGTNLTQASVVSLEGAMAALRLASEKLGAAALPQTQLGSNAITYYLHRGVSAEPGKATDCNADNNESWLDRDDHDGDLECFENRVTSVAAAYRPLGIYAAKDTLDAPLPAGSDVYAELYVAGENPSVVMPTGVLMATDREIGTGSGQAGLVIGSGSNPGTNVQGNALPDMGGCKALGELCWTKFVLSFETTRPAFTGEHLTFQIQLVGARAYAFGHEAGHRSKVAVVPAPMPASGLEFGVTIEEPADGSRPASGGELRAGGRVTFPDLGDDPDGAGDHPTRRLVEVSLDDPGFGSPIEASIDEASGTWSAPLGAAVDGEHTLYARAHEGDRTSEVVSVRFRVAPAARVEWQVVKGNSAPSANHWQPASSVSEWEFSFQSADGLKGSNRTIIVRMVEGGAETGRDTVKIRVQ